LQHLGYDTSNNIFYWNNVTRFTTRAAAASTLGMVNQGHTNSSQPGLIVGTYPVGVAVNPVTKKVYVTDEFSNILSVISGTSNSVDSTITVGNFPYGVAINPFDSRVYVTNRGSNTVSVIGGSTNTKLDNITVHNSPVGIAVNPSANWIYVTNVNSNTVSVIDGITDKVTANITVGKNPVGIAVNPFTNKGYVTNIESNTVSVLDARANKITGTITVNPSLRGSFKIHDPVLSMPITAKFPLIASLVAVNDISNTIYVTNTGSDTVSIIDGNIDSIVVVVLTHLSNKFTYRLRLHFC